MLWRNWIAVANDVRVGDMAYLTYCPPCSMGDHSQHYHVVQAVPEGVYGGSVCRCQGECKDFEPYVPPYVDAMIDFMTDNQ